MGQTSEAQDSSITNILPPETANYTAAEKLTLLREASKEAAAQMTAAIEKDAKTIRPQESEKKVALEADKKFLTLVTDDLLGSLPPDTGTQGKKSSEAYSETLPPEARKIFDETVSHMRSLLGNVTKQNVNDAIYRSQLTDSQKLAISTESAKELDSIAPVQTPAGKPAVSNVQSPGPVRSQ